MCDPLQEPSGCDICFEPWKERDDTQSLLHLRPLQSLRQLCKRLPSQHLSAGSSEGKAADLQVSIRLSVEDQESYRGFLMKEIPT